MQRNGFLDRFISCDKGVCNLVWDLAPDGNLAGALDGKNSTAPTINKKEPICARNTFGQGNPDEERSQIWGVGVLSVHFSTIIRKTEKPKSSIHPFSFRIHQQIKTFAFPKNKTSPCL